MGSARPTSSLNQAHGKNANDASEFFFFSYCVLHSLDQFDHLEVQNRYVDNPRGGILGMFGSTFSKCIYVCIWLSIIYIVTKLDCLCVEIYRVLISHRLTVR